MPDQLAGTSGNIERPQEIFVADNQLIWDDNNEDDKIEVYNANEAADLIPNNTGKI